MQANATSSLQISVRLINITQRVADRACAFSVDGLRPPPAPVMLSVAKHLPRSRDPGLAQYEEIHRRFAPENDG